MNLIKKVKSKIRHILSPPVKILDYSERKLTQLPHGGESISVETALNSRCNSDYRGIKNGLHWGMFSWDEKLSEEQIRKIVRISVIPRFTDHKIDIKTDQNRLTFIICKDISGIEYNWQMIESGMQQQAVGLVCAALGVGLVFKNMGYDGKAVSEQEYGTVQYLIGPMKPSYNGKYWTDLPPEKWKSWKQGNLSNPSRNGKKPLISALQSCRVTKNKDNQADPVHVSQLLWAARGRTPHFYNSKPWGMTIPFWLNKNELSCLYLIQENKVFEYINWSTGRPSHSINKINDIDSKDLNELRKCYEPFEIYIILCQNDDYARSFWEIGYQLMNLLVQAETLNVSYKASLMKYVEISKFEKIGIPRPCAIFMV